MKDFLGNEIHIGDTVIFPYERGYGGLKLSRGVVVKMANMVKIKTIDYTWAKEVLRKPDRIVVLK